MLNLADKNPEVKVVSDQYGSPTSALELARVIGFLIETDHYGLYHATCEGVASWYDFALYIFKLAGKKVSVKPINTEEYPTPAARPKYSVLENKRLKELGYNMKPWKEALEEYMDNLEK
jgi:dTDP-4-dehydrorhamnose reductase